MKYRVFNKKYDDNWGQDLEDFLNDPTPGLYLGYNSGPGHGIEAVQARCWESLARLLTLLVDKGAINVNDALKVVDIDPDHDMYNYEIREKTDD